MPTKPAPKRTNPRVRPRDPKPPKPFNAVGRFGKVPIVTVHGADVFLTNTEVVAYAKRINAAIESLNNDMIAKIVYAKPQVYRDAAQAIDASIKSPLPGVDLSPDVLADKQKGIDQLNAVAADLDKRIAARAPAQVDAEEAFGSDYGAFVARWRTFFNAEAADVQPSVGSLSTIFAIVLGPVEGAGKVIYGEITKRGVWTQIEGFESEFRRYYDRFQKLGYTPSAAPPPSNTDIAKEHPGGGLGGLLPSIPWGTLGLIGIGAGALYLWSKSNSGGAAAPAPTTVVIEKDKKG